MQANRDSRLLRKPKIPDKLRFIPNCLHPQQTEPETIRKDIRACLRTLRIYPINQYTSHGNIRIKTSIQASFCRPTPSVRRTPPLPNIPTEILRRCKFPKEHQGNHRRTSIQSLGVIPTDRKFPTESNRGQSSYIGISHQTADNIRV